MTVVRTGPRVVLKDTGRSGYAGYGVAPSGPVDRGAYAAANRLVGNPAGAAVFECLLGGLVVRFDGPAVVALTGTDATLLVGVTEVPSGQAVDVAPDVPVEVTTPRHGLRGYLAVAGGIAVPPVLGSRSTDALGGVGPPVPRPGDILPIGAAAGAGAPGREAPDLATPLVATVDLGPRDDWFTGPAIAAFLTAEYTVAPASDSVGVRLSGPPLARSRAGELSSEGVVRGAVQVPPDGQPIVFGADHPLTGGYPVIAVVHPRDTDRLGQARPGRTVRFALATDFLERP
ncbi:biotin-dependent carboxylase-like protein [Cryptosporangium arvum DSM 44712]|uniref:Biotin-dependent carboxylase-like protein n=2 Tax=Cryptosporangium TaxID=65502 RepID=A0A011AI25_9ACTN|nr:biotin-dependent carboxyltransferase family protein [Cryptosporangium arvum]EXG81656.1 biotin-dependent carboxylase-like protein [Cryptosporangium arvum DSM 44712]